jgi:benzoyl-CoA reductase subunit C
VPGRKAIGYMPVYVPRELIHAAGMLPVGILGGGDQLEVIQGDAYYQSYICRIPRSTIELGLTGRLDCLDGMLFPSICDVIRNLSGMWQILFKDKYVRYVDVPQNYQDEVGGSSTAGDAAHPRRPRHAARQPDHRRRAERLDRGLQRQPRRDPRPLRLPRRQALAGADLRGLPAAARRHGAAGRGAHAAGARVPGRAEKLPRPKRDNARVVINGSFCEQPPLALIKSIEMSGCYIVDDDFMLVTRWLLDDVPTDGDPLEELSKAFLHRSASTAAKYDATREEKGVFLMKQVKTAAPRA